MKKPIAINLSTATMLDWLAQGPSEAGYAATASSIRDAVNTASVEHRDLPIEFGGMFGNSEVAATILCHLVGFSVYGPIAGWTPL